MGVGSEGKMPEPKKQIPNEMERLAAAIEHLSTLISDLESKIAIVLTGRDPGDAKPKDEVASKVAPLTSDIRELRWRVDSIIEAVESMYGRSEL